MKIELPFRYEVKIQLPRNKRPVPRQLARMFSCDLPELNSSSAPVVCTWVEEGLTTSGGRDIGVSKRMEVRHYEGNFYRPLVSSYFRDEEPCRTGLFGDYLDPRSAELMRNVFCRDLRTQPISGAMQLAIHGHESVLQNGERLPAQAELIRSSLEQSVAKLEQAFSGYVVIDGGLWKKVWEPVILLDTTTLNATITTIPVESGVRCTTVSGEVSFGGLRPTEAFRMDAFDEMKAYSAKAEQEAAGFDHLRSLVSDVEVFHLDAFRFDPNVFRLRSKIIECCDLAMPSIRSDDGLTTICRNARSLCYRDETDHGEDGRELVAAFDLVSTVYTSIPGRKTRALRTAFEALEALQDHLPVSLELDHLGSHPTARALMPSGVPNLMLGLGHP